MEAQTLTICLTDCHRQLAHGIRRAVIGVAGNGAGNDTARSSTMIAIPKSVTDFRDESGKSEHAGLAIYLEIHRGPDQSCLLLLTPITRIEKHVDGIDAHGDGEDRIQNALWSRAAEKVRSWHCWRRVLVLLPLLRGRTQTGRYRSRTF